MSIYVLSPRHSCLLCNTLRMKLRCILKLKYIWTCKRSCEYQPSLFKEQNQEMETRKLSNSSGETSAAIELIKEPKSLNASPKCCVLMVRDWMKKTRASKKPETPENTDRTNPNDNTAAVSLSYRLRWASARQRTADVLSCQSALVEKESMNHEPVKQYHRSCLPLSKADQWLWSGFIVRRVKHRSETTDCKRDEMNRWFI